jgi:uncharacterized membrane protein
MCALLSMAPVSELRGAIPVGLSGGVPDALLYIVCVLANILPVPFILLFLRRILDWMLKRGGRLRRAAEWLEERGKAKSDIYRKYETLGLFILVAIPLPGNEVFCWWFQHPAHWGITPHQSACADSFPSRGSRGVGDAAPYGPYCPASQAIAAGGHSEQRSLLV